jgi:hypothetical protein
MKKAIEDLRRLTRISAGPEHYDSYIKEIGGVGNDRGMGILMVTGVEDALQKAIESRLHVERDQRDLLFGYDSPVGTFDYKIRIGHALEIFGAETKQNLELLKAIRNAFAHSKIPLDFQVAEVKAACDLLIMPRMPIASDGQQPRWSVQILGYKGRARFHMACQALVHNFINYSQLCLQHLPHLNQTTGMK